MTNQTVMALALWMIQNGYLSAAIWCLLQWDVMGREQDCEGLQPGDVVLAADTMALFLMYLVAA